MLEQREPEEGLMVALRSVRPQEHLWLKNQYYSMESDLQPVQVPTHDD